MHLRSCRLYEEEYFELAEEYFEFWRLAEITEEAIRTRIFDTAESTGSSNLVLNQLNCYNRFLRIDSRFAI